MTFYAMLRVKNEARWIERVILSLRPLCERLFVLDDHSTDGTPEACEALGCSVYRSQFEGVNETRDKNWLLQTIWQEVPPVQRGQESTTWIACIDGDEELEQGGADKIRQAAGRDALALTLKIVYLWDRPDQIRVDRLYGKFTRASIFRMASPLHEFRQTTGRRAHLTGEQKEANFHCGSVPGELLSRAMICDARLLHYGYMDREDRIRKYGWYNALDPNNIHEDRYRHIVQGDVPEVPASAQLLHAGPLELCRLAN